MAVNQMIFLMSPVCNSLYRAQQKKGKKHRDDDRGVCLVNSGDNGHRSEEGCPRKRVGMRENSMRL